MPTPGSGRRPGPGRPKGARNRVPKVFKQALKNVFEVIGAKSPELVEAAVIRGLKGKPRESFQFVQLYHFYNFGKPADVIDVRGEIKLPQIVNHFSNARPAKDKT